MHLVSDKELNDTHKLLDQLRQELNLPQTAPTVEVFRAALKLAREAAERARQQ